MATYKELQAQLAALSEQAEAARLAESQAVIDEIRAKVAEYGLTKNDIFGRARRATRTDKTAPVPKYRDPATGATWSGRGRAPAWINQKKRERFLIKD